MDKDDSSRVNKDKPPEDFSLLLEQRSGPTQTIDLNNLFTKDVTTSGSFDIRGEIWATTFGKVLQSLPIPAMLVDLKGRVMAANQGCGRFGPDYEHILDGPFTALFPQEASCRAVEAALGSVFESRKTGVEEALIQLNDYRVWARMTFRSIRIMEKRFALVMVEDLTSEKRDLLLQRRLHEQMFAAKEEWERTFDSVPDLMVVVGPDRSITRVNKSSAAWFGCDPGDLVGTPFTSESLGIEKGSEAARLFDEIGAKPGAASERVVEFNDRVVEMRVTGLHDAGGSPAGYIYVGRDVTDRIRVERALRESEARLERALKGADLGLWDWNILSGEVVFDNRWADMLGYDLEDIQPSMQAWESLIHPDDVPEVKQALGAHLDGRSSLFESEHRLKTKDGEWKWVSARGTVVERSPEGRPIRAAGTHVVIEKRKQAESEREKLIDELTRAKEALQYWATHDELTGLLNRRAILQTLRAELNRSSREGSSVGVIMADIDHFKLINDEYGHSVGDAVLKETARRLRDSVRPYDSTGRYGGEEFVIVVPGCDAKQSLETAKRLREGFDAAPVSAENLEFRITISFGVLSVSGADELDLDTIIRKVDTALYKAKQQGRNTVHSL